MRKTWKNLRVWYENSTFLKPPLKPPNPLQEKDLRKILAEPLKNHVSIFDAFTTNTFPCHAAWIFLLFPCYSSPLSLVLVYSLCSPRLIS